MSIALKPWVKTVAYCENDSHAQAVLLSRMSEGKIDAAPICDDIKLLTRQELDIPIDIVFGGFPCQDISVAGNGKGLAGERSGLFFEIIRLVKEISPRFVFLENVPAIRTRGLLTVANEFTKIGYDCRWTCITASSVGAPHKRERWFLLAHTAHKRCDGQTSINPEIEKQPKSTIAVEGDGETRSVADTESNGSARIGRVVFAEKTKTIGQDERPLVNGIGTNEWSAERWAVEPNVGRVANGVPLRVERLKRLGNAVVPNQARQAFKKLFGMENSAI